MYKQLLIQYFHWYYADNELLWNKVKNEAENLSKLGITGAWLPPAFKSTAGGYSVGYDPYDLYDLGEFDQKGTIPTKYGTKEEYLDAINTLKQHGISTIADVVFNHKAGADELETIKVRRVNEHDRNEFVSEEIEIQGWTKFTFPGRNQEHSPFIWDQQCFTGIDRAENLQESGIFSIQNEYGGDWEQVPSTELGNYDYLMFNDIEFRNPAVREELKRWGEWYYQTCGMDGFRLDAVKHISADFLKEWIDHMKHTFQRDFFIVAENWVVDDVEALEAYVQHTEHRTQLFDSILHHNFYVAAMQDNYDLSSIFDGTLVQSHPELSVTFVDNHDSQPLQALASYVEYWFRPLAYALILLRQEGIPCLFYPDLYGCTYSDYDKDGNEVFVELIGLKELPAMCEIRKDRAHGLQRNYLDHPNCIGWTMEGTAELSGSGMAVVMSNGDAGHKDMEIGKHHAGHVFVDALENCTQEITINEDGWAQFTCEGRRVSVWVLK
jgi:alpha-amylase